MENKLGLRTSDMEVLVQAFSQVPQIEKAFVFGSRTKNTYKQGSDIDIALKGEILPLQIKKLHFALNEESLLPYKIDLIHYETLQEQALKEHIDRVGVLIYTRH